MTLDDDVAATLIRLQKKNQKPFKQLVNEALREGLLHLQSSTPPRQPFRTRTANLGRCLVGNLDDVEEVLSIAEGESFQ